MAPNRMQPLASEPLGFCALTSAERRFLLTPMHGLGMTPTSGPLDRFISQRLLAKRERFLSSLPPFPSPPGQNQDTQCLLTEMCERNPLRLHWTIMIYHMAAESYLLLTAGQNDDTCIGCVQAPLSSIPWTQQGSSPTASGRKTDTIRLLTRGGSGMPRPAAIRLFFPSFPLGSKGKLYYTVSQPTPCNDTVLANPVAAYEVVVPSWGYTDREVDDS